MVLCVVSLAVSLERLVKSVWMRGVLLGDWAMVSWLVLERVDVVSFEKSVGGSVVAIALGGCGERRVCESVDEKVVLIWNG